MTDRYLDLDAIPKREGERTLADVRQDGGTPEEQKMIHSCRDSFARYAEKNAAEAARSFCQP